MKKELSPWCKRAKFTMLEQGISGTELSQALGYSRGHINAVINGRLNSSPAIKKISDYLNISDSDRKEPDDRWI